MKARVCGGVVATLALCGALATTPATVDAGVVVDSIDLLTDIDYFRFTSTGGHASFNIYAYGFMGSELDSYLMLAEDDGSPIGALTGAYVTHNDDTFPSWTGWDADGSTSLLDSYIWNQFLFPGDYILGVASYLLTEEDFRDGYNDTFTYTTGAYQLTYEGVELRSTVVPEPASIAILGLMLAGVGIARRRRRG